MDTLISDSQDGLAPVSRLSTSSVAVSSPTTSMFSRGHSSRGSGSSVASSPIPRDSLDMFGVSKRLEDVTEEPHEKDDFEGYTLVNDRQPDFVDYDKAFPNSHAQLSLPHSPVQPEYTLKDTDIWAAHSTDHRQSKRRRSMEQLAPARGHRFGSKFGSLSRRWRNRSAAGPRLSIITHMSSPACRSAPLSPSQILSPALSAMSKHESLLPSSPVTSFAAETPFDVETEPIDIDCPPTDQEDEPGQATTPLLPPMFSHLAQTEEFIHSPLQSPSIAPTSVVMSSQTSFDSPISCLPSPPLSTKPSMVSMHNRSRTNTVTNSPYTDIPPMQLFGDSSDPWAVRLGHANFTIHPEPYLPEAMDLDLYAEFRHHWDQARTNYAKHISRTAEHYGSRSKVYKLTEEKWASVDETWKRQHARMTDALAPVLARLSNGDSDMHDSTASSAVLEEPLTKVVLPVIDDKSGKFPKLGDGEIVGPMSVARPRVPTNPDKAVGPKSPPLSPHKRQLLKFFSDIFRP